MVVALLVLLVATAFGRELSMLEVARSQNTEIVHLVGEIGSGKYIVESETLTTRGDVVLDRIGEIAKLDVTGDITLQGKLRAKSIEVSKIIGNVKFHDPIRVQGQIIRESEADDDSLELGESFIELDDSIEGERSWRCLGEHSILTVSGRVNGQGDTMSLTIDGKIAWLESGEGDRVVAVSIPHTANETTLRFSGVSIKDIRVGTSF